MDSIDAADDQHADSTEYQRHIGEALGRALTGAVIRLMVRVEPFTWASLLSTRAACLRRRLPQTKGVTVML